MILQFRWPHSLSLKLSPRASLTPLELPKNIAPFIDHDPFEFYIDNPELDVQSYYFKPPANICNKYIHQYMESMRRGF